MNTMTFRLPWPPSVNNYYGRSRKGGHVYLKEAGRIYRKKAAMEIARLGRPRIHGHVRVHLILSPPDRRTRDIDNIRKCLYDAISDRRTRRITTHRGIIPDDANIRSDSAEFIEAGGGFIIITITKMQEGSCNA